MLDNVLSLCIIPEFVMPDVTTGELKEAVLEEGKTADIGELTPHQLEALVDGSIIFEVSTTDNIEDRFRLAPGDSQTKPVTQ